MTNLKAKTDVRIGSTWYKAGDNLPADHPAFDYEKAALKGFIEAEDGSDIKNPAAPQMEAPAPDSGDLARLKEQHAGALKAAADKAKEWERVANENDAKVTNLTQDVQRLQDELTKAQASAASPEDQAALAEYREVVGTLLAHDFPSRKILLEHGYYTPETVQAASDNELNGLKGISDGKLADIRKVAPYSSGE